MAAAGNSDSNAGFGGDVPASLHLPSLSTVGAVNQAGDETCFTSYGDTVVVDADGYNVESFVPGGARLKLSGTSMATPQVVNFAAKLFALRSQTHTGGVCRSDSPRSDDQRRRTAPFDRRKAVGRVVASDGEEISEELVEPSFRVAPLSAGNRHSLHFRAVRPAAVSFSKRSRYIGIKDLGQI